MLVTQLVDRFKYIHEKTFVHRDIKPDNFLMGLKEKSNVAYIVDYGLAKRYYDPRTGAHIPYRNDKSLTGTARYASIHAHLGEELARRDDLEALGFVMLYFFKGVLPWQNLPAFTRSEKYRRIKETKIATSLEDLCVGCPPEFLKYMKHCRGLNFEEKPDYQLLIDMLKGLAEREGIALDNNHYDWEAKCNKLPKPILPPPSPV
jgi:serine/threonine protein kinase